MAQKYGLGFVMTVVLLVASLLVMIIALIVQFMNKERMHMLYAALGVFIVACWPLSVSQYTPFIFEIYYVDGFMGFLFCMMMPFSLLIYINEIQNRRYNKLYCNYNHRYV